MKCPKCNMPNSNDSNFCVGCGYNLKDSKSPFIISKNKKILVAILVICWIVITYMIFDEFIKGSIKAFPLLGSLILSTLLLLFPALIITCHKNPKFVQLKEKHKKTKTERENIRSTEKEKLAKLAERKKAIKSAEKAHAKKMRTYKGVYLTEQQIDDLESKKELPIVESPVFLQSGEVAIYYSEAKKQERNNRQNTATHYPGELVLTNHRFIFLNEQKGFEIRLTNITTATEYKDAFVFQSRSRIYEILMPCPTLFGKAFWGILNEDIPIHNDSPSETSSFFVDSTIERQNAKTIDFMEGHDFEYFCADVLRKNGFYNVKVTKGSGDQGVDILAEKNGIKYAIQCKNYSSHLGNTPVQEVNSGKIFYNCHVGVVMTNSYFTQGAKELAKATGVILWDRDVLEEMIHSS